MIADAAVVIAAVDDIFFYKLAVTSKYLFTILS